MRARSALMGFVVLAAGLGSAGVSAQIAPGVMRVNPVIRMALPGLSVPATVSVLAPRSGRAAISFMLADEVSGAQGYARFQANPANGESHWAEVTFTALPAKGYIIECAITGTTNVGFGVQIGGNSVTRTNTNAVGGKASALVPAQPEGGARRVFVAGHGAEWRLTQCTISPT